jgi:hypothetical protein
MKTLSLFLKISFIFIIYFLVFFFIRRYIHYDLNLNDTFDLTPWMHKWISNDGEELRYFFFTSILLFGFSYFVFDYITINNESQLNKLFTFFIYSILFIEIIIFIFKKYYYSLDLYFLFFLFFILQINFKKINFFLLFIFFLILFNLFNSADFFNYSYFVGPANKILNKNSINSFFFQYNIITTYLFVFLQYLNLDFKTINFLLILFYLIFIFVLYNEVSKKLFPDLRIYFILLLLIVRGVFIEGGPASTPQVSPLRMDLWVFLILSYFHYGTNSLKTSLVVSILYLFDDNFGFLYILLFLFLFSRNIFLKKYPYSIINISKIIPILICLFLHFYYFHSFTSISSSLYQKYHFGFEVVSLISGFWVVLFSIIFCLFFLQKSRIFNEIIFLLFGILSIQLVYFYGRSNESNLYNISGIFLVIFFTTLYNCRHFTYILELKKFKYLIGISVILFFLNSSGEFKNFFKNLNTNTIFSEKDYNEDYIYKIKKSFEGINNNKIVILSENESIYNYKNKYYQHGDFAPFLANFSKQETIKFLKNHSLHNCRIFLEKKSYFYIQISTLLKLNNFKLIYFNDLFYEVII